MLVIGVTVNNPGDVIEIETPQGTVVVRLLGIRHHGQSVRLGFDAPKEIKIYRREVLEKMEVKS